MVKYNYENNKLEIFLKGEIDIRSCKSLRGIIDGYIMKYGPEEFVLDLSDVTFMDSSGIGLIMGRYKLVKTLKGNLKIINTSQRIERIIKLSGLYKLKNSS